MRMKANSSVTVSLKFVNLRRNITLKESFLNRLAEMGQHVGVRILDVLVLRERGFKRETKLLNMLLFIKSNLWKVCIFIR